MRLTVTVTLFPHAGTVDEKLDFAFDMTDMDGTDSITFDEWVISLESMVRMYGGIMGQRAGKYC